MKSHTLTTDLKYTYESGILGWTIYKDDEFFAQIFATEKEVISIVAFLNENMKED